MPDPTSNSELGAIIELQQMIAEELEDSQNEGPFSRAFMPLTNGLGLESPKKGEVPVGKIEANLDELVGGPELEPQSVWDSTRRKVQSELQPIEEKTPAAKISRSIPVLETPVPSVQEKSVLRNAIEPERMGVRPPPVPRPAVWRRGFAAFVDVLFVLGCFAAALLIIANLMTNSKSYFSLNALTNIRQPVFVRYALMAYSTLWFSYFALGLGILDMTVGMWVWGLRVGYSERNGEIDAKGLKKMIRIILSLFFFAPIFPILLLAIRIRGKNIVDGLSGTQVYRNVI